MVSNDPVSIPSVDTIPLQIKSLIPIRVSSSHEALKTFYIGLSSSNKIVNSIIQEPKSWFCSFSTTKNSKLFAEKKSVALTDLKYSQGDIILIIVYRFSGVVEFKILHEDHSVKAQADIENKKIRNA